MHILAQIIGKEADAGAALVNSDIGFSSCLGPSYAFGFGSLALRLWLKPLLKPAAYSATAATVAGA